MVASTTRRVPANTPEDVNERIRLETERNIAYYSQQDKATIDDRLAALDEEWDIERVLEANAAGAVLTGVVLGTIRRRRWYLLCGLVGGFLMQHAISGWCPPLSVFRRLGFRTAHEIESERCALLQTRKNPSSKKNEKSE